MIIAAIIGTVSFNFGKNKEQENIQNQIDEMTGNIINITDGENITINNVSDLVERYLQLQDDYAALQLQNNSLVAQNIEYFNDLTEANSIINDMQYQAAQETEQLQNSIENLYEVDFQNLTLTLNGIESDYADKVAVINNETFYSIGFLQYLVDNQAVSSDASRLFIGDVQSEERMPVLLFNEDTYLECGHLSHRCNINGNKITDLFIDNNGKEYFNGVYRWIPNFDTGNTYIECLVDDYSTFAGTIILNYEYRATPETARLLIYGDGEVIYASPEMTRGLDPVDFSVDIANISLLRVEFTKAYELISLVNPYLYP